MTKTGAFQNRRGCGSTGAAKGPARRPREIDVILARKRMQRLAAEVAYVAGLEGVSTRRAAVMKRAVLFFFATLAAVLALAALAHALPQP